MAFSWLTLKQVGARWSLAVWNSRDIGVLIALSQGRRGFHAVRSALGDTPAPHPAMDLCYVIFQVALYAVPPFYSHPLKPIMNHFWGSSYAVAFEHFAADHQTPLNLGSVKSYRLFLFHMMCISTLSSRPRPFSQAARGMLHTAAGRQLRPSRHAGRRWRGRQGPPRGQEGLARCVSARGHNVGVGHIVGGGDVFMWKAHLTPPLPPLCVWPGLATALVWGGALVTAEGAPMLAKAGSALSLFLGYRVLGPLLRPHWINVCAAQGIITALAVETHVLKRPPLGPVFGCVLAAHLGLWALLSKPSVRTSRGYSLFSVPQSRRRYKC